MLRLQSWLASLLMNGAARPASLSAASGGLLGNLTTRDSLQVLGEPDSDGARCLSRLAWRSSQFDVVVQQDGEIGDRLIVKFPSPVAALAGHDGDQEDLACQESDHRDLVVCDWFPAPAVLTDSTPQAAMSRQIPAVLVVHELGERMVVGRTIARGLQRMGLHAFLVNLPGYGHRRSSQGGGLLTSLFDQAIVDVRRAADAIACLPTVDGSRVALQGTSLGGFIASISASFDDRFHSTFLCLSGADLYSILQEGSADARETRSRLAAAGLEGQRLAEALWNIEPVRIASRLRSDRTWLYSGRYDKVVPLVYAHKLADAAELGANHKIFPVGHYTGFVCLPRLFADVRNAVFEVSQSVQRVI